MAVSRALMNGLMRAAESGFRFVSSSRRVTPVTVFSV